MIINMIPFDELFSTWIFGWYILYITGVIQYSPKYWFIIALVIVLILAFIIKIKIANKSCKHKGKKNTNKNILNNYQT